MAFYDSISAQDRAPLALSPETRRRVEDARVSSFGFDARRILKSGGFSSEEVESILSVLSPYVRDRSKFDATAIERELRGLSFADDDARDIAEALAQ